MSGTAWQNFSHGLSVGRCCIAYRALLRTFEGIFCGCIGLFSGYVGLFWQIYTALLRIYSRIISMEYLVCLDRRGCHCTNSLYSWLSLPNCYQLTLLLPPTHFTADICCHELTYVSSADATVTVLLSCNTHPNTHRNTHCNTHRNACRRGSDCADLHVYTAVTLTATHYITLQHTTLHCNTIDAAEMQQCIASQRCSRQYLRHKLQGR